MANVTLALSDALKVHDAHVCTHRRHQSDITDEFLREAYRINAHILSLHDYLRSIRQGYLSTSIHHRQRIAASASTSSKDRRHFTDAQRDQIDAESKATLRDLNSGIRQLDEIEILRKDTQAQISARKRSRNGFKSLGRWAAGGVAQNVVKTPEEEIEEAVNNTVNMHRESVIWYLRRKLEETAEVQRSMMETRLEREVEKSKSILYKTKGTEELNLDASDFGSRHEKTHSRSNTQSNGFPGAKGVVMDEKHSKEIEQSLSPEQLQLFAQENNEMLKHYEDTLDQVRTAERSMIEISELQTTLAQNLEMQSTRIDQMMEDSVNTEQNVVGGNKQLKRATERWRPAKFVFYVSCGLSAFLIAWDLII